ncbi:Protein turtle, partial [Gryllus bimaculatus]
MFDVTYCVHRNRYLQFRAMNQVTLETSLISGYPPPTVSWTKNNQELISLEGKLSIKYDHNRVEVILNDATVQDAGKYTCKVVNNVGSASSTADIVVKKTFLPPIFGRRLQARSVKEGERVVMEVEITGIPDPDVTWYKDGQQILSTVPDSSFRTKVQGNCYSLIIEKVSLDNSGQYLVKAVNSKGEAASMADIVVNKQESPTETIIKVVKEDIRESEIELEHTPSPIFFKPDAHYEIPKEHTVLPQQEKENKTQVFAPTLPVTQEFKTELHIDEVVERNISSPFLPTSPVKEMQKEVECQSTTEEISPLKGDANAETSLLDQPVVKKILINLELEPTTIEDNSMTRENSVFEYKSVSPSMDQPELKAEYIEIKNENKELQGNEVTPVEIVNDELRIHHTDTVQSSEDTGVETASVSKKQAYEFFINKIKEFEEENAKPIIKKPIKLPSQEVPRFTGSLNTGKEEQSHDQTMYYSSIPTELKLIPYTESKISEFQSDQSINIQCETQILHQQQSSDSFVEEFCVRHEPLLEIDNLSKSEIKTKSTDDASTQTKSSEEINKGISPIKVPIVSGNVFHPSVSEELQNQTSAKNIVFTSATKTENIIKNEATPSNTVDAVVFPAVDDGTFLSKSTHSKTPELPKEAITTMQSYMDSVTFTSSKSTESLKHVSVVPEPISVPVLVPEPEPMYIEPTSSEFKGIQSETPEFSQMESQTSICVRTDTAIPPSQPMSLVKSAVHAFNSRSISEAVVNQEQIPIQPISSKPFQPFPSNTSSEGLEKEKMLKPFESKSELFVHTSSSSIEKSEIVRSVSPKPSAEGLAMEKLWIPQMTRELEITIPKPSVDQKHVDGVVSPKPSVEGLAMDKLWAHKHPDSSLKKIWPPPQHSENKPIIPWSTKATSEKMQLTVDSVVDQKEETVTVSHKSAAQMVSQSVPIPPPEPNSFQNSEAKETNPEVQQVPPVFWHGENLPPTSLLASESGSDALTVNAIIPASQPAPVVHYVANASVIHSAATINQEIRTTEIFRNTEIKEEKTEVSKLVHQSEITTNDLSSTADKYIINQYEEKKIQPVALNERFQAKSLSCDDSVPHQKEKRVIASETLKDIKKREEKPLEDKKEKSKTLPLQKQPFQLLDLEPFPFQPQTPVKHRPAPCPPPPKPSKFIKGEFVESDYESEFESHIPPKWRPYESDTEELTYRRVKPPLFTHSKRPKSTEPAPLPPSSFEKPLQSHEILRPVIDKSLNVTKEIKSTSSKKTVSASTTKSYALSKTDKVKRQQTSETSEKDLPVVLKPGSPPEYVQAIILPKAQESQHQIVKTERVSPPKYKLDSSKSKTKPSKSELPESGYMADTDEPRQFKSAHHKSTIKHEESFKSTVEKTTVITGKTIQQSSHSTAPTHTNKSQTETKIITQPHSQPQQTQQNEHHQVHKTQQKTTSNIEKAPPSKFQSAKLHHKHLENKHEQKGMSSTGSTKSKKEIISTFTSEVQKEKKDIKPVPVKPVHPGPPVKQYVRHSLPSPSKFVKGEFRESDYESDYESRIPAKWRPGDSDADEPKYKPVHPLLAQKGFSQSPLLSARTPTPPTEFDNPPEFSAPPRPKFEPIEKPSQSCKTDVIRKSSGHHQKVFKPKPITPKTVPPIIATPDLKSKESEALKPGPCPEIGYAPPPPPKTKINIAPFEKATQIETSKIMNISESTEHMHRVVNVQQTTHVIRFGEKEREVPDQQSETFPFKTDLVKQRTKRPVLTTPKKFVPGDFYESEYESDLEAVKIKPKWTPGNSDTEEPHYRKVRPPQITHSTKGPLAISSSQPPTVSTESNLAATTNTTQAISIQKGEVQKRNVSSVEKIRTFKSEQNRGSQPIGMEITRQQDIQLQPGEPPEFCFAGNVASVASYVTSKHMSDMTNTFRSKAQQFASDIMTDVGNSRPNTQPEKIITKQDNSKDTESEKCLDDPQAYREESRVSEYGTKHIDPDTGLIYFKYDFGYEFGIVLPNEGKKQEGSTSKYPQIDRKQAGDIEVPVIHEKNTKGDENITSKATETKITPASTKVPQFKPKKFTHFKAVKWEPASESEMSEAEGDSAKMKKSYISPQSNLAIQKEPHIHIPPTQWGPAPTSPLSLSLSPSLPSLSPCTGATLDSTASPGGSWQGLSPIKSPRVGYGRGNTPTPPSTPSTPRSTSGIIPQHFCKPPSFITTLRDITVMKGQPVCFECIVQAEPLPNILWAKDGRLLENSLKHQLHFRNGVCRLTLSQASPDDSGNYTCTATNKLGTVKTSGLLQVPEVTLHFEDQDEAEKEYFAHWKATNVWSDVNIHSSDET